VRISAQLIEGSTGNHVWAERYDRDLEDVFAVQDEITQTVVGAIEPELLKSELHRARVKPPENLQAQDCYSRGMCISIGVRRKISLRQDDCSTVPLN